MSKRASRRNALGVAMTLVTFSLGLLAAVFVAGSASASGPLPSSTTDSSAPPPPMGSAVGAFDPNAPQAQFLVINGTVNAASDHEIVGSSAFPNFTTGAVDNYYSMSRAHMDNSPFAEATASPFDTGPVGQTAAAGNFQQPQYADARWPGGPDKATYGSKGQPFAEAGAFETLANADATDTSNGLSGPGLGGSKTLPVPKGFDSRLETALAGWKAKVLGCPAAPKPSPLPKLPAPKAPKVTVPKTKVPAPPAVTTPVVTVAAPNAAGPSAPPAPSTPAPVLPSAGTVTRSLSAVPPPCAPASGSGSDGESMLASSAESVLVPGPATANSDLAKVDTTQLETTETATTQTVTDTTQTGTTSTAWTPKPYTLMIGGESSMGRVSLGHGQIVIDGIHVKASVENDGTAVPTYKANISVASASIGGIPVTIDEDGVHVAGQHQGLPYKQTSDSLNSALKQAGIQLFLVAPQVTNCSQGGTGTGTTTTTTEATTTTTDQSGAASPCGQAAAMCGPGMNTGTGTDTSTTDTTTTPTSTDQTDTTSTPPGSCPPPDACGGTGTGTDTGTTTTTSGPTGIGGATTTSGTTTTTQTDTTSMTSNFCPSAAPQTSGCPTATTTPGTTTTSTDASGIPPAPGGATGSSQETVVTATGVHVVFTQPVSPSGVPAQFVEHILGEVYIDSLAAPATPIPALGPLSSSLSSSSSSPCGGGPGSRSSTGAAGGGGAGAAGSGTAGGSSLTGGTPGSGALSTSGAGSGFGAGAQPTGSSTGGSLPAMFASALRKPLWLLLAYLVWQVLVIGTGMSLWNWRREDAP